MLPLQFFSQNIYFAINLFAALVFFAVFWLQLDAWTAKRDRPGFFKWLGFLLLSIAFVVHATYIEQSVLQDQGLSHLVTVLSIILRIAGYGAIILGQIMDPLQKVPELQGITEAAFAQPEPTAETPDSEAPATAAAPVAAPEAAPAPFQPPPAPAKAAAAAEAPSLSAAPEPAEPEPVDPETAAPAETQNTFGAAAEQTQQTEQPEPTAQSDQPAQAVPSAPPVQSSSEAAAAASLQSLASKLQPKPKRKATPQTKKPKKTKKQGLLLVGGPLAGAQFVLPVGALTIGILYWRRATTGLERHYKPVALAFWLLTVYELMSLAGLWQDSDNPRVAQLVASYAPLWLITQLVLLLAAAVLGAWVWRYLMRRFMSQLFMIFIMLTLGVFLFTTVSFTYLLVSNIQKNSLANLKTAASVLDYAVSSKESETKARVESIAQNPELAAAVVSHDRKLLQTLVAPVLPSDKLSSLIVTNDSGQVLMRAEDADRYGDSLSSDSTIRRALIGTANTTVTTKQGVLAPVVYIKSTAPIRDPSGRIVGALMASLAIDNSFVDGIKNATGLDSAVYAGNVRSATTFVAADGVSRWIGVSENSAPVRSTVLMHQQTYQGTADIQNQSYLAVYTPLKDVDNKTVGMLFIGQPQSDILKAAGHSVELTFIVTAVLLMLSIIPAYVVARYLTYQLD